MDSISPNEDSDRSHLVGSRVQLIKYFRIREKLEGLRIKEIRDTGFSYSNNTEELARFLFFPGGLLVQQEITNQFGKFWEDSQKRAQGGLLRQELERIILGVNRGPKPLLNQSNPSQEMIADLLVSSVEMALSKYLNLDEGINLQNPNFRAMCRSAIVMAWTNFEVSAGLIWENGTKLLPGPDDCDLQNQTKEKRRPNLQGSDCIRTAFNRLFGEQSQSFQVLKTNKSNYEALAQCRHIFVHRSGEIDQKFINKVQGSFPDRKWVVGERLSFSLKETVNLIERSIDVAIELFLAADQDLSNKRG